MEIIFGPVPSRRFGRSLGVSIVPEKICSLDCIYCELIKTPGHTVKLAPYIAGGKVLAAFNEKYPSMKDRVDIVTVTGSGEPTLNSDLERIALGLKSVISHPLMILTNATMMYLPEVVKALNHFDIVVPSLDAVVQKTFCAVDKPADGIDVEKIIESLVNFSHQYNGKLILEILLVKGINDSPDDLLKFARIAKTIKYHQIQVGTVFRPPAWSGIERLSDKELEDAYLLLMKQGLNVAPVGVFAGRVSVRQGLGQIKELIKSILSMRPVTLSDISAGLELSPDEAAGILDIILSEEQVAVRVHENEIYYRI